MKPNSSQVWRITTIRLKDKYASDDDVTAILRQCQEALKMAPDALEYRLLRPSDIHTRREWHFAIWVRLADQEVMERWRQSELYRALFEEFIAPMRDKMRVTNWTAPM